MADEFYATTTIRHGKMVHNNDDPTKPGRLEEKTFEPGDKVEGLTTEDMKQLWNSGALERREGSSTESSASTSGASGASSKTPTSPAGSEK